MGLFESRSQKKRTKNAHIETVSIKRVYPGIEVLEYQIRCTMVPGYLCTQHQKWQIVLLHPGFESSSTARSSTIIAGHCQIVPEYQVP